MFVCIRILNADTDLSGRNKRLRLSVCVDVNAESFFDKFGFVGAYRYIFDKIAQFFHEFEPAAVIGAFKVIPIRLRKSAEQFVDLIICQSYHLDLLRFL